MSRIKKRGLDYFPISTDFIHDRIVRRIMKKEGDAAVTVLVQAFCSIYSNEGYYVMAGELFYDDLADNLYQEDSDYVRRVIALAVEYGLFDFALFQEYGLLTSADIQRQFLFATKRRNASLIDTRYCLLSSNELAPSTPDGKESSKPVLKDAEEKECSKDENAAVIPINATFSPENNENMHLGTHSIAQHSIAQNIEEEKEENFPKERMAVNDTKTTKVSSKRKEWTLEEIALLQPPRDGMNRNFDGLIYNLGLYSIPPAEQYAIVCKSNFGVIGHPVWNGFYELRNCHGKIRLPGRYLLSLCQK